MNRRQFLRNTSVVTAALCGARLLPAAETAPRRLFSGMGVAAPLAKAGEVKTCGAEYLVEKVADFLMPTKSDAEFARQLELVAQSPLPVKGCNNFLGANLRSTGPDADHPKVLAYAEIVFRRMKQIGGEFIVFGSSGSRSIPPGWAKEKADEQFVALLKEMGPLAAAHKIMLVVEPIQKRECNYLMHLGEVTEIVAKVNYPGVRALADLYHMTNMGDAPADLARAVPWLWMIEIAEKEKRTAPGTAGDDFRPYFKALAAANYSGRITIEGNWTTDELRRGFEEITRQSAV